MSNLFIRLAPEIASKEDIDKVIQKIKLWNWETGFSFAHIVLDDYNLDNGSILFCLEPKRVADWTNGRIESYFGKGRTLQQLEKWEWDSYKEIVQMSAEIVDLLSWLLNVPEEIRRQLTSGR